MAGADSTSSPPDSIRNPTLAAVFALSVAGPGVALAAGPLPVDLLSAGNFSILSKSGVTDVPSSVITGNVGSSPITGAAMHLTCPEVTGTIYAADATGDACFSINASLLTTAISDQLTAYNEAAARTIPDATNFVGATADIGGLTIYPGLYKYSTNVGIATDVTLDAQGDSNAVWIFQISGDLTIATGGGTVPSGIKVILTGKAKAANVFWQVGGTNGATLNTYSTFNGNIMTAKDVLMRTSAVLNGRALSPFQVVLDQNKVTKPAP